MVGQPAAPERKNRTNEDPVKALRARKKHLLGRAEELKQELKKVNAEKKELVARLREHGPRRRSPGTVTSAGSGSHLK
jgi:hypothetical protein